MTGAESGILFRAHHAKVRPSQPVSRIGLEFLRAVYSGGPADAWHERLPKPECITGKAVSMKNTAIAKLSRSVRRLFSAVWGAVLLCFYQIKMEVSK